MEGPNGLLIEQALRFVFKTSNNQAEYEALIVGMLLAKEMGAQSLLVKSDFSWLRVKSPGSIRPRTHRWSHTWGMYKS